jgi:hypothetical protein
MLNTPRSAVVLFLFLGACGSVTSTTGTGGNGGGGQAGASGPGGATGAGGGTAGAAGTTTGTGGAATGTGGAATGTGGAATGTGGATTGTGGATTGTGGATTGTGGTTTGTGGATPGTGGATPGTGGTGTGTGGTSTGGASGVGGSSGAAGSTATGGASGAAGSAGAGGGSGVCGDLIDNMESDDGYICTGSGRMGYWYTYIDGTTGSSIAPPSTMKPILPTATSPARAGSNWAMHASGIFQSYAGIGCILDATLNGNSRQSFNASAFTGVHFWAHGTAGMKLVLQASGDELISNGGTCTTTCYGSDFTLAGLSPTAWTEYSVPFSSVTGGTVPLQPSDLWSVEFGPVTPGTFDMWIDDLSFY